MTKTYYQLNREKIRAKRKAYYSKNRERILAKMKAYHSKNHAEILAKQRAYYEAHPLKRVWVNMMTRCSIYKGASAKTLARYAGRGITVCEEWRRFQPFEQWALANGWKPGLQIDRIDNDGNYHPDNCRFVSPRENTLNRRCTVRVRGVPLVEYYDAYANKELLSYNTFITRVVTLHWPVEKALYTAVKH